MKTRNCVTGLLGAMVIISVPLQLQAQLWPASMSEAAYGGPAAHAANSWHADVVHRPSPYGYLWSNYCNEATTHEMRRMQHFMETPDGYGCDEGCTDDKRYALPANVVEYRHDASYVMQPSSVCEDCSYSHVEQEPAVEAEDDRSAEPPTPPNPGSATVAPRPIREPVYLSPVDDNDPPATTRTERTPVIRLAPVAPTPMDSHPENGVDRIPRNALPTRP